MPDDVVVACMMVGQAYEICVDGELYQFDWHYYSGPQPTNKNGSMRKAPWPRKVWNAVQLWHDQGKILDEAEPSSGIWTGLCFYTEPEFLRGEDPPIWDETEEGTHIQVDTEGKLLRYHVAGYGDSKCDLCVEGGGEAAAQEVKGE